MSLLTARVLPRIEPRANRGQKPARRLRPVAAPHGVRRPKLAYAALAVGGALAIGAAQMGISLASTHDAFVLAELNHQQSELRLQKQALGDEVVAASSPQELAARADRLGLVVAGSASYLKLSDGTVRGAGDGASWISTVAPNGATKVGNALIPAPPPPVSDVTSAETTEEAETDPALPPVIGDGLPSPTTH
ncbi:hypothetical protein Q9R19_07890 [Microbacterium sp. ARD32]|uniref:hypothetical protein n=1 Tax=Microbacterium sp. ARD32 TaxID=2962577 RepID=UPI002880E9A0|nr:hypothetical protein [Microbacterium sp. ARD32]MDT0157539.1 hypothetical protein [Microbacterium sp. ARD32]